MIYEQVVKKYIPCYKKKKKKKKKKGGLTENVRAKKERDRAWKEN